MRSAFAVPFDHHVVYLEIITRPTVIRVRPMVLPFVQFDFIAFDFDFIVNNRIIYIHNKTNRT